MTATLLTPLMISLPIGMAALMAALAGRLPRQVLDVLATATAVAVAVLAIVLLLATTSTPGRVIAWAGGWTPRQGESIGIALVSDPISAGLAVVAAVLATAVLVYSWRYFDAVDVYFHALVLVFLAAMCGFVLTGDLFDMFVWFELMSAVAYALTGYKVEEAQSVQGALNFGVTNSIGAFCTLIGITLLYDRTGALNFAALGANLAGQRPDALVTASFVLLVTGFLTKAAVVPFHFWTADAEAVAPIPVCALFSGIMVELGVYAVARVYWTVYSDSLPASAIRTPLLCFGVLSAVVGAVMCLAQRHLKRLLAFSTVSHIGLFLIGVALLSPAGLAGTAVYVLGQAGVKAALFLLVGVVLLHLGSVNERDLHGRGRGMPLTATLMVFGGIALAGLPPFATGLGKAITEEAGAEEGFGWLLAIFVATSALTGAAVLRMAARVFFGLGSRAGKDPTSREAGEDEDEEVQEQTAGRVPRTMLIPPAALLTAALGLGLVPGLGAAIGQIAADFIDRDSYAVQVLRLPAPAHGTAAVHVSGFTASGIGYGVLSAGLAMLIAAAAVYRTRLPRWTAALAHAVLPPLRSLRALHSGHVGDYAMWLVVGVAALGGAVSLILSR